MKTKLFISILFCSLTYFSNAQSGIEQENKNKWGCAIAINSVEAQIGDPEHTSWGFQPLNNTDKKEKSFSLSIIPKYFINDDILLRFEFGLTNINAIYNEDTKDDINHTITKQSIQQKIYRYAPGVQWIFLRKKYVEVYCGATLSYINYNTMKYAYKSEIREILTDTITFLADTKVIYRGGYATGIGFFTGFNFFLQKHISAGSEFSSALLYYKLGGENNNISTYQSIPSPPVSVPTTIGSSSYKGFQFVKIMPSFNISVWF